MICQYCGKSYQEVTDTRPSNTCYSCNREFVSVHPSVLYKFETELTKKDAEIERLNKEVGKYEHDFLIADGWVRGLKSKMDKVQKVWVFYNSCGELVYDMTTPFEENKDKVLRHWNWTAKQVLLVEVEK